MSGRRERSRSPLRSHSRFKDNSHDGSKVIEVPNALNPLMIPNMFPQGNMMMGGMYNMMLQNSMMAGSIMPASGMEMMPNSGLEIIPQQPIDMQAMHTAPPLPNSASNMDMGMMGGVMMDPAMMAMYQNMTPNILQEKKEIVFKHCKLIPPAPGASEPPKRTRPPGCRTIFVGGLPEKIREGVVRDIFETYGRIQILRLSKKNFCHIRFDREICVEAAMVISGYRIKLISHDSDMDEDEDDESHSTNGWLNVDYALSRDDQNEYDRRQRQAMRVQQQMQQISAQQDITDSNSNYHPRSPSPVRLQPFSNAAITQLAEKIKSEEAFAPTLPTLISWLERGECSKKNSNQFYSMLQATNSHIRRLFNEKMQAEEELSDCKERVKNTIQKVIEQLEQVAKVFVAATHQRVWDHFTKPQRKNIETWQKMTQEFSALKEEFNERFCADEHTEFNGFANKQCTESEDLKKLKRENESLEFQLEAYKNEVDVIKADAQKEMEKFKAQFIARQALKGTFEKNPPLPSPVSKPPPPPPLPEEGEARARPDVEPYCGEARLIGVMSAFLQVHPQGASLDYVVSYVRALFPNVSQAAVHDVLQKFSEVFERSTSGVGANIEHRWKFIAFHSCV